MLGEKKIMPFYKLIWLKAEGCYHEFGIKETMRRIVKEILSTVKPATNRLDISIITDRLAIGASPKSDEAIKQLLILRFNHIIDLRAERRPSDILISRRDIRVSWVPTYDDWRPKSDEFFRELAKEVNHFFFFRENGKLLLCCGAGEHRAPLAGVLTLVMLGFKFESEINMIQRSRPQAELLPVYISSLKRFLDSTNQSNQ